MDSYYKRNVKLYTTYHVFFNTLMIWSINIPFLKFKGLSFFDIMVFYSGISVLGILFEIPAGIYSDKKGYKKSLLISSVLKTLAIVLMIKSETMVFRLISMIFFALSESFFSGTDAALLHKSLEKINALNDFGEIIKKTKKISMFVLAIVVLFSGSIYDINEYLPFILSAIIVFCSSIVALFFYDESFIKKEYDYNTTYAKMINSIIKGLMKYNKTILIYVLFGYIFSNMNFIAQEVMDKKNLDYRYFGLIFFISNMISVLTFKYSYIIEERYKHKLFSVSVVFLAVIFVGILLARHSIYIIVLLPLMRISSALVIPRLEVLLNNSIDIEERATYLSFSSAISKVVQLVADPVLGIIIDMRGIYFAILLFVCLSSVLYLILKRNTEEIKLLVD